MSNEHRLFVHVPEEFYNLDGLTTLDANLLALIAAFRGEGLRLSNNRLGVFFNVQRRSVVRSVNRLRAKGYITDKGGHRQKRRLVASGVILSLLDSVKKTPGGVKMTPEVVTKCLKTGVNLSPITKGIEEKVSTASPLPASEGRTSAVQINKASNQASQGIAGAFVKGIGRPVQRPGLSPAEWEREKQRILRHMHNPPAAAPVTAAAV
ncbi:MAG: MarR family transcriptional regulator [Sedimentisphaerales bacterium]|nr:MarR family transcriptional regulator [Sedimentisphaerales bacterium]